MSDYLAGHLPEEEKVFKPIQSLAHTVWDGRSSVTAAQVALAAAFERYAVVADQETIYKLLVLMADLTGQELSCSHLSHHMGMPPKEVLKMLAAAKLAGIWRHISCFDRQDEEVNDKSKGYLASVGLAAELLGITTPADLEVHRSWGALFEGFIINTLLAQLPQDIRLFYWRTTHGMAEVDVVMVRGTTLYPVEIKSAVHASLSNAKKIALFSNFYHANYQVAPGIIAYAGDRYYRLGEGVFALPWSAL